MATPATNSNLKKANAAANNNQNPNKVGATKQPCPIYDVIVLLAGTVDPVNSDHDKLANSFEGAKPNLAKGQKNPYSGAAHDPAKPVESRKDSDYYWTGNKPFIDGLIGFQKSHDHVHVFGDHGWSGDNCVKNRELAGKFLGDWFVGIGYSPALPTYLKRKVSFHLIGHSHGGNVMNEFTKSIAKIAWPADWKIKSYVYLSTPFFQTIHKPNPARNHGAAKVCNVVCKYDLTQAAIADFSLRQLTRVTDLVASAPKKLKPHVDKIVSFDGNSFKALAVGPDVKVKWNGWTQLPSNETTWNMDPTEGRNLYTRILDVLKEVKLIFDEIKSMVVALNEYQDTRVSEPFLKKGFVERRKIISDGVKNQIVAELDQVLAGIGPTETAMKARVASGVYPVKGFFSDIKIEAFVTPLINLLDINAGSLDGKIPRLLYAAFKEQIEVFDDTLDTCNHIHKIPIVPVDVTSKDKYYQKRDPQFYDLKSRLIKAEQAYMGSPNQFNFTHMLFLLAANIEDLHEILVKAENTTNNIAKGMKVYSYIDSKSSFYLRMMDLIRVAQAWIAIFKARYCGGIEAMDMPRIEGMRYGSVGYLAMVSHSVSRVDLYPQVDQFLRAQFDSHETKPMR
ncbi:MAG TPA: hypothetical protein PK156_12145 [Polyangium sp.]|nr:hypothetical protein [Polyangium sp.]